LQVARHGADQGLGQLGAREAREVVVADVERVEGIAQRGDELGVAMAQVEHAAVEMEVEQLPAIQVPQPVALPPADHQIEAHGLEGADAVGADVTRGQVEGASLRVAHVILPGASRPACRPAARRAE
jgi:hypothetical protein